MMWLDWLLRLYPQAWRERYEDEYRAMLEQYDLSLADWVDMLISACETRLLDTKGHIMKDVMNRLTGGIVLLSALMIIAVFLIPDEDTAEFYLVLAPILSLGMIPAMHRVLKIHKPLASRIVMGIGMLSIVLLIGAFIIVIAFTASQFAGMLATSAFVLLGIWLISVNALAIRIGTLPSTLGIIGIVVGVAWCYSISVTMITSLYDLRLYDYPSLVTLQNMSVLVLLGGYLLWAFFTGLLFITGQISRKLQLAY